MANGFVIGNPVQILGTVNSWPVFSFNVSEIDEGYNDLVVELWVNFPNGKYVSIYPNFGVTVTRPTTTVTVDLSKRQGNLVWPKVSDAPLLWDYLEEGGTCNVVAKITGAYEWLPSINTGPTNMIGDGQHAPDADSAFVQFTKARADNLVILEPARNLGVLQGFAPLEIDLIPAGDVQPYVLVDTYINLPENRYVHFQQEAVAVDEQSPSTKVTVNLPGLTISGDDGNSLGTLWENLEPGTVYSIVVKFQQSSDSAVITHMDDHLILEGQIKADTQSVVCVFTKTTAAAASAYNVIVTDIGEEKIAQRIANGQKLVIKQAGIDDGNGSAYTPQKSQTSLFNEVWRGDIAAADVDGNTIRTLIALGASVGNFWARAVCLYDEDGDMVAIAGIPATEKVASTSGVDYKLKILLNLIVTDASAIHVLVNPVLNTVDYEQLQEALADMTAVFEGDLTKHNGDPLAHPAVRTAMQQAIDAAVTKLTPKQYGSTGGNNYAFYTLYPDGSVVGGGYTNAVNANGDDITLTSCGLKFTALQATASYVNGRESELSVTVGVNNLNTVQPVIHIDDDGGSINPRAVRVTFAGRVAM